MEILWMAQQCSSNNNKFTSKATYARIGKLEENKGKCKLDELQNYHTIHKIQLTI
jgi:hypothetical protein